MIYLVNNMIVHRLFQIYCRVRRLDTLSGEQVSLPSNICDVFLNGDHHPPKKRKNNVEVFETMCLKRKNRKNQRCVWNEVFKKKT